MMNNPLRYRTPPLEHQRQEIENYGLEPARALFHDQGTGKTYSAIMTAYRLEREGRIAQLLVVCPNGLQHTWDEELSKHWPDEAAVAAFVWDSQRTRTKTGKREFREFLQEGRRGFQALLISYDGVMTDRGADAVRNFVDRGETMVVADESQRIKTPGAKRTKRMLALGKRVRYKRILTGTPITKCPFDIYSQMKFLAPDFWKGEYGLGSAEAFRNCFAEFSTGYAPGGRAFKQPTKWKNMDLLKRLIAPYSSRVRKEEVLDLPPKVYTKWFFELSKEQRRVYNDLREELVADIAGEEISTPLLITRLLRFQQVCSGFVTQGDETIEIPGPNPRVDAFKEKIEDLEEKAIVFACFKWEIDRLTELLGKKAVRYDGQVKAQERQEAVERFQSDPDTRFFVGNPAACGLGLTLTAASEVLYFSNSFNLEHRLQSEDRAHRIGQKKSVLYTEFLAKNTISEHIVAGLRAKRNLAALVTGDSLKEWI